MLSDSTLRYADIQACCTCLGFREGNIYKIDVDAEASIRALLRYLRNENSLCDVRCELGRLRIVSTDLIPMLKSCKEDKVLTELVIRLLMNLTQPAIACFRQQIPKDRELFGAFLQVDTLLKSYKKDFADEELFRLFHDLVSEFFDRKWEERSEDDRLLVERILVLVRNALHITHDPVEEGRVDEDISVHDQLLWTMHLSGWDDLLLFLGNSDNEQMFGFHTLEILSLMLREQSPEILASAGQHSSQISDLTQRFFALESAKKRRFLRDMSSRQNIFGGTYQLIGAPSVSNLPVIVHHDVVNSACFEGNAVESHNPLVPTQANLNAVSLDYGKRQSHKPKNRKPLVERPVHRRSIPAVETYLQNFCWQFIQLCYNPLMRSIRAALTRQTSQENDETYFLWAMRFFMAFCRLYKFRSAYLSETLSPSTFHWIYDQIMHYRELLFSDKKGGGTNDRALQVSRRLELSISAYREFLTCLSRMLKVPTSDRTPDLNTGETEEVVNERLKVQASAAESLMANIFYISEYQEVYPMLLRDFNEALQSRAYLQDLIEGAYLFTSLLADWTKSGRQNLIIRRQRAVKSKRRSRPQTRTESTNDRTDEPSDVRALRLSYQWTNQLAPVLISGLLNSSEETEGDEDDDLDNSTLFDAASSGSEERQIQSGILRIKSALFAGQAMVALRLARRLWRLWPEVAPVTVEDDDPVMTDAEAGALPPHNLAVLAALRQIHMTEFDEPAEGGESTSESESVADQELYGEEFGLADSDSHRIMVEEEVQMDLHTFMCSFAHPKVVHCFMLLLADYSSNPRSTNNALIRLIHQLVVKQKLLGAFFQLRLFHIFQTFLHDKLTNELDEFKDLTKLIKYILRKFFEAAKTNNAIYVELLFPKSMREIHEILHGYGTYETRKSVKWTPESDTELTKLFEAYRNEPVPRGSDLADILLEHFSDKSKTRRQLVSRLITLGLISSAKQLKQITSRTEERRRPNTEQWTEDQVNNLRTLADMHAGSRSLASKIMSELENRKNLPPDENPLASKSRRAIAAKLVELGLLVRRSRRKNDHTNDERQTMEVDAVNPASSNRKRVRCYSSGSENHDDSSPEQSYDAETHIQDASNTPIESS